MCGKGGGSPCLWICYVFLFCTFMAFEHNYNRACGISFFIAFLTFINGGGKNVIHNYYNCIIKLKAAIKRVGGSWLTHKASESGFKHTKCV